MSARRLPPSAVLLSVACLAASLLTPAAARAADTIGLWYDTAYTQTEATGDVYPQMVAFYLVMHDPSAPDVGGWECRVDADGPVELLTWDLEGLAVNFETPPSFAVGLGAPLPYGPDILLATGHFMVTGPGPVAFSLLPTRRASIPDHMAYIGFSDPNLLLPLTTASGLPEVAWFNREMPVCEVVPESIDFGNPAVGMQTVGRVIVRNLGGGTLWVTPTLAPGCDAYHLITDGGLQAVPGGEELIVLIGFVPPDVGTYTCTLDLGTDCSPVALSGVGRPPIVEGIVVPNPLDFGDLAVGSTTVRPVTVTNAGEVPLDVHLDPGAGCGAFSFSLTDFTLPVGSSFPVAVTFTPPDTGSYACAVDLGAYFPPLQIVGAAHTPIVRWSVSPLAIEFGAVGLGSTPITRSVLVRNLGEANQTLAIALEDPDGVYEVVSPLDPNPTLAPSASLYVQVRFTPAVLGTHPGVLHLGGGAPDVALNGTASEPVAGCAVTVTALNFGQVPLGFEGNRSFRVNNTGNTVLTFTPQVDCDVFAVTSGPTEIPPGGYGYFNVTFRPSLGTQGCILDLGPDACTVVALLGEGITNNVGGDANLVAVSFAPDYVEQEFWGSFVPFDAYIMLVNPSYDQGVWGWELALSFDSPLILLTSEYYGQTVNFLTPPEYLVGIASPLPNASLVVLAHLTFIAFDTAPHTIAVGPVHVPSIPGQMAWAYNSDYELATMSSITGDPVVAIVNGSSSVAVQAPTPVARLDGGRVELTWPLPTDGADGCHVYRRIGAEEARLTSSPLLPSAGGYTFSDDVTALPPGAAVAYSYSLVRDGVEFARSLAATVELPAAGSLSTRLLPNRPNPFNPETDIHFTLAKAGHARVAVYDLTGRRIAVLLDESRTAGPHQVTWRGRDDAGRSVPSGAYYVRLETSVGQDTRKVMLLK